MLSVNRYSLGLGYQITHKGSTMNKSQLKTEVLNVLNTHDTGSKKHAALTEALTTLLESFVSQKKATEIPKHITIDKVNYIYCSKHQVYEVATNFKNEKSEACLLAVAVWNDYSVQIKESKALEQTMITDQNFADLPTQNARTLSLTADRKSVYNMDENDVDFKDVEGYDYNAEVIKPVDVK